MLDDVIMPVVIPVLAGACVIMVIALCAMITRCAYQELFSDKIELIKSEWVCSESKRVWTGKNYSEHCIVYKRHE